MNSQSDLTIDRLFTIVTANALNDPPAGSHPRQGATEAPGLRETLRVATAVSKEHTTAQPLVAHAGDKERARRHVPSALWPLCPPATPLPWKQALPSASWVCVRPPLPLGQGRLPRLPDPTTAHCLLSSEVLLNTCRPSTSSVLVVNA